MSEVDGSHWPNFQVWAGMYCVILRGFREEFGFLLLKGHQCSLTCNPFFHLETQHHSIFKSLSDSDLPPSSA